MLNVYESFCSKKSNTSNLINHIINHHRDTEAAKELSYDLKKQKATKTVRNLKRCQKKGQGVYPQFYYEEMYYKWLKESQSGFLLIIRPSNGNITIHRVIHKGYPSSCTR